MLRSPPLSVIQGDANQPILQQKKKVEEENITNLPVFAFIYLC